MERIKRKKGKLRKGKHRTDNIGMRRKGKETIENKDNTKGKERQ